MAPAKKATTMALTLEIEYLSGVAFAAIGPESELPDWPPQPDRVFSALLATWGAHGEPDDERLALEWLEGLSVPRIDAQEALPRSAAKTFVPPNDFVMPAGELHSLKWYTQFLSRSSSPPKKGGYRDAWKRAWGVMPDERKRSGLKERRFPGCRLHDSTIRLHWKEQPDPPTLAALDRLARDTAYIGHSASLTRCRFTVGPAVHDDSLALAQRRIYPGRLEELRDAYDRFHKTAGKKDRPSPGALVIAPPAPVLTKGNVFSGRWLVLEHAGGDMPDLRATALVARGIRAALMSGYGQAGAPVPPIVSGHEADGDPSRAPHLAIVPLSFVGWPFADGRVLGYALVPPEDVDLLDDAGLHKALRKLARRTDPQGRRILEVRSPVGTAAHQTYRIDFALSFEPPAARRSLDPGIYTVRARRFATATPIVLDRHLKKKGQARQKEIESLIARACCNVGLPPPQAVFPDKHSALEGAPSAYPSGGAPAWMRWRLPQSLTGRQLAHAVIRFAEPIDGPVILGAGRFVGLGLCRPLAEGED